MGKEDKDKNTTDRHETEAYTNYKTEIVRGTVHDIYMGDEIMESKEYFHLLHELNHATTTDTFVFHLNNYGGYVASVTQLINTIRRSKAKSKMIVEAPIYSAATDLALCVKDVHFEPFTYAMFHTYSDTVRGKGQEILASVTASERQFIEQAYDYYYGFLTKKEISDIFNGKDIYIHTDEANKRIAKRNKKYYGGV